LAPELAVISFLVPIPNHTRQYQATGPGVFYYALQINPLFVLSVLLPCGAPVVRRQLCPEQTEGAAPLLGKQKAVGRRQAGFFQLRSSHYFSRVVADRLKDSSRSAVTQRVPRLACSGCTTWQGGPLKETSATQRVPRGFSLFLSRRRWRHEWLLRRCTVRRSGCW